MSMPSVSTARRRRHGLQPPARFQAGATTPQESVGFLRRLACLRQLAASCREATKPGPTDRPDRTTDGQRSHRWPRGGDPLLAAKGTRRGDLSGPPDSRRQRMVDRRRISSPRARARSDAGRGSRPEASARLTCGSRTAGFLEVWNLLDLSRVSTSLRGGRAWGEAPVSLGPLPRWKFLGGFAGTRHATRAADSRISRYVVAAATTSGTTPRPMKTRSPGSRAHSIRRAICPLRNSGPRACQ